MSEPQGHTRTNISLPRELKARMDAVQVPVNWSAVAAQAFEAKLLELECRKEVKSMDDVVARMRAANQLDDKEDYQAGRAAGERWAQQEARPRELQNLPQLRNLRRSMDESSRSLPPGFASVARDAALGVGPGVGWHVYFGMLGRRAVTTWTEVNSISAEADAFWRGILGPDKDRIESASFGQGFVDGALGIWESVKDRL